MAEKSTPNLQVSLATISTECIECGLCVRECAFLKKYGTPKAIADGYDIASGDPLMPFACSLCRLCAAVCPVKIDPGAMFLAMRRAEAASGRADFRPHRPLLGYEQRGTSSLFSLYALPPGCDTVFFPGCALSGTRAGRVVQVVESLAEKIPGLGVVLDCCTKPSHDLGRSRYFDAMFTEMYSFLKEKNVRRVLTACPSCHWVFKTYAPDLETRTVYEFLVGDSPVPVPAVGTTPVTVQDSCVARDDSALQESVRSLILARGGTCEEMKHHGRKTFCCGEGGGVGFAAPEYARIWGERRRDEVGGRPVITYCAGCAGYLARVARTVHLLDYFFAPDKAVAGRVAVARSPFTYLHRLLLKYRLRKRFSRARLCNRNGLAG